MIQISDNLKEAGFIAIRKNSKLPIAKKNEDWNNKILNFEQANAEIKKGNNVAIVGGVNGFIVVDCDNEKLYDAFNNHMYKTYTETSISGNKHLIYRCDNWTPTKDDGVDFNEGKTHLGELRAFRRYVVIAPSKAKDEKKNIFDVRPYKILEDNPVCLIDKKDIETIKNSLGLEKSKEKSSNDKDETRSGLEFRKVIALLFDGKSKEEVFEIMKAYSRWTESDDNYRNRTFENAKRIVEDKLSDEEEKENEITWLKNSYMDNWNFVKAFSKKKWGHKQEYKNEKTHWTFFAHSHNRIVGKPQLVGDTQIRIPLIRMSINKYIEFKDDKKLKGIQNVKHKEIKSFYFFDEKFDKRHDGFQVDAFAMNFWAYKIVTADGLEYYVFSQTKLPNETCTCNGMIIELDDFAEMSRSMKIKSLSRVFILKDFEPAVKILSKDEVVAFTKTNKITEKDWFDILDYHPLGTMNKFPEEVEYLRSAHVLSGRKDGYPLHLGILGVTGTRKSCGYIETIAHKFSEEPQIIEGGDSRIKGLSPSFKEKPANIGYLARCERMGWVDEIGKMIEFELNKHQTTQNNALGELNFLLEHKLRLVGSGNDNDCKVQATAKFIFVTNPIANRSSIYSHVGLIDATFMSRLLWWVQDKAEVEFVTSEKGVVKIPPTPTQEYMGIIENRKKDIVLKMCWGKNICNREQFLTLFDTCYSFTCDINEAEVQKIVRGTLALAKEPMKSIWKNRAEHHTFLVIDGLCKHRCLFKDYDSSFIAKQQDYDLAQKILTKMVNSWDTDLTINEELRGHYRFGGAL